MTLFSRPVWGQAICGSITGSKIQSRGVNCYIGCSPAFWCKHTDLWSLYSPTTPFNAVFGECGVPGGPFLDSSLERVICAIFAPSNMLNDSSHPDRNPDLIKECAKGYGQTGEKCVLALEKLGYHAIASLLTATAVQVENIPNEVTFPMSPQQVIAETCAAISDAFMLKSRQPLITQSEVFEIFNEAGCQVLEQALGLDPFGEN